MQVQPYPARGNEGVSRRNLIATTAWTVPIVSATVAAPLAAATGGTTTPLGSDVVLAFAGGTTGSTQDISAFVIDWIKQQLLDLGPQVPPEPVRPVEPPAPEGDPMPVRGDFTGLFAEARYQAALVAWRLRNPEFAEWLVDYAEWQVERAKWAAENAEVIAQRIAWEFAIAQLETMMNELAAIGEMLFSASISYPQNLVATNAGPKPLVPGDVVTVTTTVDSNLINAHLPSVGGISLIQTGGTSTLSYIVPTSVPVGAVIFTQPLSYNPASVTLNIQGSVDSSSVSAELTPRSLDTDVNDNGDFATAPIGVTLNVLTGDLQEVLDRWEQLASQLEDLRDIWDLISPYIDWESIISGVLPLPQTP